MKQPGYFVFNSRGNGGVIFINKSNKLGTDSDVRFIVMFLSSKG